MKKVTKQIVSMLIIFVILIQNGVGSVAGESQKYQNQRAELGSSALEEADSSSALPLGDSSTHDPESEEGNDVPSIPQGSLGSSTEPETGVLGLSAFLFGAPVLVNSFAELEAALFAQPSLIILTADIVMGKTLNISSSVVIDGNNHTISEGMKYRFVIQKDNIEIEIRNATVKGFNYYGFVTTVGSALGKNAVVTYRNVDYYGPQLAYLLQNNTLRLIDSRIILGNQVGSDYAQELAEVAHVEIGGTTLVHKKEGGDAFIWFNGSSTNTYSLTILDGAQVTLTNDSTYLNFNQGYFPVDMVVGENATLKLSMQQGMNYSPTHIFSDFTVKKGAKVEIFSATNVRPLTVRDNFILSEDSQFVITNGGVLNSTVLNLTSTATNVIMDNPKLVYIQGRTSGGIPNINLKANVLNTFFNTFPAIGGYPSNKSSESNGIVNGHSAAYPGDFVTVTSKTDPMNYFNTKENNGFIAGQFDMASILLTPPTAYDTDVTLSLAPQSEGKMTFVPKGEAVSKTVSGVADTSGTLVLKSGIPLDENGYGPFVPGEEIMLVLREKITETTGFLHVNRTVSAVHSGVLSIEIAPVLEFGLRTIQGTVATYPLSEEAVLTVKDDRATPSNWKVKLQADPLTQVGGGKTLDENAIGIMKNDVFVSLKDAGIVWEGSTDLTQPLQSKIWARETVEEGLVVRINPNQATVSAFTSTITWTVEISP